MNKRIVIFVVLIVILTGVIYWIGSLKTEPIEYSGKQVNFLAKEGYKINIKGKKPLLRASDKEFFYLLPSRELVVPLFPEEKVFGFPWDEKLFILEEYIQEEETELTLGSSGSVEFQVFSFSEDPVTVIVTLSAGKLSETIFWAFVIWVIIFCILFAILF